MEITWLGHSCFRLRGREGVVVTDPFDKSVGYSLGRVTADVVTVSHRHPHHEHFSGVTSTEGEPRLLDGPGEYEVKGIVIAGLRTFHDGEGGKTRGKNTAFLIEMEDVVVCHLGDLGHVLTAQQAEAMSDVDVLLVPVGGYTTINAAQAAEVISLIEPKIVVPMHYRTPGGPPDLEPVERFLRQMGVPSAEPQPRLAITSGSLPEVTQVVLLEPRRG
jgi:L-ascorbate metabolism protein UlaG (beta-lactamase superfamily)